MEGAQEEMKNGEDDDFEGNSALVTSESHGTSSMALDGATEKGILGDIKEEINEELELMAKTDNYQPSLSDFSDDSQEGGTDVEESLEEGLVVSDTEGVSKTQGSDLPSRHDLYQRSDSPSEPVADGEEISHGISIIGDDEGKFENSEKDQGAGWSGAIDENDVVLERDGIVDTVLDYGLDSDDSISPEESGKTKEDGQVRLVSAVGLDHAAGAEVQSWDVNVLLDHGLDSEDELDEKRVKGRYEFPKAIDSRVKIASSTSMADSDPEVAVGDAEGTFDFDVTKDHGLNSDSEEEEEDEDTDAPPPKKKKRFRPWKNLKRIFKKKKIMEPKTELKDDQQQNDEQENDQEQVVSTEQYLLSKNQESPTRDNTSAGHSSSQEDISRRRTDSDEGLPLSPDSPALTFDLTTSSEQETSVHGSSGAISPEVESRQHSQVHKGLYHPTPSPRLSLRNNSNDQSGSDFDSVTTSPTLNSDAAKHRISVKPSARRPSSRIRSPQQTTPTAFDFDANSLSFASESIDEETEMEEKSTMSIVYEKKDAEGFREGKRPLNGILDQLIEESKEAYTYDIDPVEVPLSPTVVSSKSDKEENVSIKESDRNFMFNSQSLKLEDANGDGLGEVAQNEVQDQTREEDVSESKADELVADDTPAEEGLERRSEIMGQLEGKGSDHGPIEMEVETSAELTDDEIRLETKTEETEGVNLKDEKVVKTVQVGNVKSESREDEDEKTKTEVGVEDDVKEEEEEVEAEVEVEEIKQVEVEDKEKKVVIIQKPSPSPRQRSPPQTRPRVSFELDESNKEETKDLNGNEDKPLTVKDRILRLQSKSFTSSQPAAPIKRSPRWTLPKSKPSSSSPTAVERKVRTPTPASSLEAEKKDTSRSLSPTAVERKVTTPTPASSFQAEVKVTSSSSSPTAVERKVTTPTPASSFQEEKVTSPSEGKVEKVKADTPEIKPTPTRKTPPVKVNKVNVSIRSPPPKETSPPPPLRGESKDENANNKSKGGVKALIMRFQETQQQVSSTS